MSLFFKRLFNSFFTVGFREGDESRLFVTFRKYGFKKKYRRNDDEFWEYWFWKDWISLVFMCVRFIWGFIDCFFIVLVGFSSY